MSTLKKIYTSYKCKSCCKETILLTEEVEKTLSSGRYITCAHCNSKKLKIEKTTDDLREVTKERQYKRINRRMREVR